MKAPPKIDTARSAIMQFLRLPVKDYINPLLISLGHPETEPTICGLYALHAGSAFHRLALISDVVEHYMDDARLPSNQPVYIALLHNKLNGICPRAIAKELYRKALLTDDQLAEAWFNLGRLLQDAKDWHGAQVAFGRATSLPPHPNAPGHAHLHANAYWHIATILEESGRNDEALASYREAISRCDNFGVHHIRYAHFLRRLGLIAEATENYQKLMTYSHRYFTEFALPPLVASPPATPAPSALDIIYEPSNGGGVVFWNNEYYQFPTSALPMTAERLFDLVSKQTDSEICQKSVAKNFLQRLFHFTFRRSPIRWRRAASIAEFEA